MLRFLVIKKRHLYITLGIIFALIIGTILLVALSKSDETFSESLKYAYRKISCEQAQVLISKNKDLTIIDVRKENDYLEGHLPEAILMPYRIIKEKYASFDRQNKYLVYCDDGKDSEKVAKLMANDGFQQVFVLAGGIKGWNYPLTK